MCYLFGRHFQELDQYKGSKSTDLARNNSTIEYISFHSEVSFLRSISIKRNIVVQLAPLYFCAGTMVHRSLAISCYRQGAICAEGVYICQNACRFCC